VSRSGGRKFVSWLSCAAGCNVVCNETRQRTSTLMVHKCCVVQETACHDSSLQIEHDRLRTCNVTLRRLCETTVSGEKH